MGRCRRLGALRSTSTLRPCKARDMRADNGAAMRAGLSTGSGNSSRRSRSPPRRVSSSREPKTRTWACSPATSRVSCRMAWICSSVRRMVLVVASRCQGMGERLAHPVLGGYRRGGATTCKRRANAAASPSSSQGFGTIAGQQRTTFVASGFLFTARRVARSTWPERMRQRRCWG